MLEMYGKKPKKLSQMLVGNISHIEDIERERKCDFTKLYFFYIIAIPFFINYPVFVPCMKYMFELCWEILQGMHIKDKDGKPAWYKTRSCAGRFALNDLSKVQVKRH